MSIKTKFEKINLDKLKSDSPQAYNILNGWASSTKNFSDDKANEVIEPLFNKLYDKLVSGKFWYVIEGNKQPSDQVAEPITKKEEVAIVKEVIKSEPTPKKKDEPKTKSVKAKATKTHTASTKPKHTPTPPKMDGKSVFEIAKELRAKDSTLTQKEAVKKAGQLVKDAHKKVKDDELQALMKMIKSDPAYSVLKPEKNTSIIRDLGRPAIRTTKRVSKKGWKNQYGASEGGRTYYENRVNRMDVNKVPMYAKGGSIGYVGQSIYLNSVPSPKEDRFLETEIVIEKIEGNKIVKSFVRKTGEKVPFIIDSKFKVEQYADGGMMDKGGELNSMSDEKIARIYANMKDLDYSDVIIEIKGNRAERQDAINEILRETAKSGNSNEMEDGVMMARGGINIYNLKKGDKVKTRKGNIETIERKTESGYFTIESEYSHPFESLEFVSRPSKMSYGGMMAKGGELANVVVYDNGGESFDRYTIFTPDGSVYGMSENASGFNMYIGDDTEIEKGSHLGKKLKSVPEGIKKAVLDRMSETFAKGGSVVGDYSVIAYKTKYDYENDTDETYSGMSNRSLDYVIDEFDSRIDSGLIYGYKVTKSGDFANVIYQISRDTKGGVSKRLEKTGKDYSVLGYKTKSDFNDLDDAVYSGVMDRSLENTKNLFDDKIKSGMWYGYQIFESGDMRNPIYTNTKDGEFAKGGKVRGKHLPTSEVGYARRQNIDKLMIGGKEISEDDFVSGVFFKKSGQKSTKPEPSNSSAPSKKASSKAGYFYVPKSDILSIDFTKNGESYTTKNINILDGAYIKISALKYAMGGRLSKDVIVYVPKSEIEEIKVSNKGFKVKDVTEDLLSGIHLKASALRSNISNK